MLSEKSQSNPVAHSEQIMVVTRQDMKNGQVTDFNQSPQTAIGSKKAVSTVAKSETAERTAAGYAGSSWMCRVLIVFINHQLIV